MPTPEQRRAHSAAVRTHERPLFTDASEAAASAGRGYYCTCAASPFCRGAGSEDWATCSLACKVCHPRPQRRRGEHLRGEHDA